MSESSVRRSSEFLRIADQFKLGVLVTESSHPVTANLSEVAKRDTAAALDLLFQVDQDVVRKYKEWAHAGNAERIAAIVAEKLSAGGRVFFTGCGSTGRLSILLDSVWRRYWLAHDAVWADRTVSLMAGGDFALIKAVEGFEDVTSFGRRQIAEEGVCDRDVVFAITEGGETSWVIGTAWEALNRGAKVFFVYNNPDNILRYHVERSRQVIEDSRIEKINLTTGPMAITGSTRMQATTIQLWALLTVLEMVARRIGCLDTPVSAKRDWTPGDFVTGLEGVLAALRSPGLLQTTARLVETEESVYRRGGRTNYFSDSLALDVLTDTTERSPTFSTPPFRKYDDAEASESWVYLFTPPQDTKSAWQRMLCRTPKAVDWTREQVAGIVPKEDVDRRYDTISRISLSEIYKFRIGLEGMQQRPFRSADAAVAAVAGGGAVIADLLQGASSAGAATGVLDLGNRRGTGQTSEWPDGCIVVRPELPEDRGLLDAVAHVAAKTLLNALSTCVMVRLGRVMGNYMIYVAPSNLKLIDRSTRYISRLTGISYEEANSLLFEVIEYVDPRMKCDQAYPPVVGLAVMRHKYRIGNKEAEERLDREAAWASGARRD